MDLMQGHHLKHNPAFTLIELLIVIAIIAILALIAVPNFLEAQTRAKISRAMADMTAYDTALRTYQIDNGAYPQSVCPDDSLQGSQQTWPWLSTLTTPISYMTSLTFDPFSKVVANSWGGGRGLNPFHMYTGNGLQYWGGNDYFMAPRVFFMLMSIGPNGTYDMTIDVTDADRFVLYDVEARTNVGGQSCYGMPYEPTNGTVSEGDIYRFSGKVFASFKGGPKSDWGW